MRQRKYFLPIWIFSLAALLAGCGSSSSTTNQNNSHPVTGLKKRVLLSNETRGFLNIIDAQKNVPSASTISMNAPSKLVTAGGITAAMSGGITLVTIVDNATEAVTFPVLVADVPNDIVITKDGKTVWVAEPNNGFVQSIDTASGAITTSVPVPSASRLVLSPSGSRLLVFSDNPQGLVGPNNNNAFKNAFFVIDTAGALTTHQATPINLSQGDQPFSAVFSTSETQAFILNCGSGCGGNDGANPATPIPPSILNVDFTNASAPGIGSRVNVNAATTGILSNGNLFVAGTTSPTAAVSPQTGFLQAINASTLTPAGAAVQIADGLHTKMAAMSNGRLYIASVGCNPGAPQANNTRAGCLTIANVSNPAAISAVIPAESVFRQNFDVTGIQPISNTNIVYVVQGGELDFFDITTDAVSSSIIPVDISGLGFDAVQIDP
jgi:uncharacterized protein YceK